MTEKITDKTEALAAVKDAGWELANVSDELKADKEVFMVALKSFGDGLQYASDELKAERKWLWKRLKVVALHLSMPLTS